LAAERAPVAGVYLVARQDVTEPAHLREGRIGVLSETGQLAIRARALLRAWGITATLVPLGTLPKIYAALRAQDIDAGMLTEEYHRAAQRTLGLTAFPIPATGAGLAGGGWGAKLGEDGMNATVCINDGDTHNSPVEAGEAKAPLLIGQRALRQDSGGAGKWCGGLGVVQQVEVLTPAMFDSRVERTLCPP
jgi:hypothetical protein